MNPGLPPPPALLALSSDRGRGPAWVWRANVGAAVALLIGGALLVVRLAVYVANADDHLTYEALGFAQLFGVAGIVLLTPFVLIAVAGTITSATRSRAGFVCNIVVGVAGTLVARGFGSLSYLVVVPMAAVVLGSIGLVTLSGRRGH